MKILYINSLYAPDIRGGAELSLKILVEGMQSRGHEVLVLCLQKEAGLKEETVDGVKVYRAGLENHYWPYDSDRPGAATRILWHLKDRDNGQMGGYISEILQAEKPDIVSCHNLAGWSIAAWESIQKASIPIVQVLHDLYLLCPNSNMFKGEQPCGNQCFSCKLLRSRHLSQSQNINAVVGISNSILSKFTQHDYFQNALQARIFNTRNIPDKGNRPHWIKGKPLKFGYLGTLSQIKGLEWLMESFKEMSFPAELLIAGSGKEEYVNQLKSLATDQIQFVGYVNPAEFLQEIDVLVVPSLWEEPLGMVAIEALAYHRPVIAHKSGGLQETVKDKENGLYCYANHPESLTEAMNLLAKDQSLFETLSSSARASVSHILNQDRMLDEYEEVMNKTVSSHHPKKAL
ncbi:glycosyl transferase family 1 [Echinicola pacifica]|uniref:Glycosyl transferase family 1 n=1 Tax=Echinicola pacifica TaxID=346377 RepID=A0A918UVU3_9BACT|nr:glycosyltransferase family 4 protein [Echinicola pacifica]GGZ38014.1 glycosyl transferase family 1 [Echinicola pacifica]